MHEVFFFTAALLHLNSLPSLLNHLRLPSQETPSFGLRSSYSLGADPTENAVSIVITQQCLYCCLLIRCRGNLFSESLPSNERHIWLSYSGFQTSCHSIFTFLLSCASLKINRNFCSSCALSVPIVTSSVLQAVTIKSPFLF
jgi:hypothetical protein